MSASLEALIEGWDGQAVVTRFDESTRTWIFICLHDASLGACTGGTRMSLYPEPAAGLRDAMRLAEGMTFKWAAIGMPHGGGKAVLALDRQLAGAERSGLLRRYGALVQTLGGIFRTGEDLGTSPDDFEIIAESTDFVQGVDPVDGRKVDPSPFTARGVFAGLQAACGELFGIASAAGRTVLIEGVGNVGRRLADLLAGTDARLLVSDIDPARAARAAEELGARLVAPELVCETPCDVYAPCAVGATLDHRSIPRLACRIVAGSANNQLSEPEDAERLRRREILYVPDYIINAGGAMSFGLLGQGIRDRKTLLARMDDIGTTVREILREAARRDESPVLAARRRVETRLDEARRASGSSE